MPIDTPDQQLTRPIGADPADNPQAFIDALADIETRLVKRYTDVADRLARNPTPATNELSMLATETRAEVYDGANHVSMWRRGLTAFKRRATDATAVNNSTALVSDDTLFYNGLAAEINGVFLFGGVLYFDASAAADAKFAFVTTGAGVTIKWGLTGYGLPGTTDMTSGVAVASGTAIPVGAVAVGTQVRAVFDGEAVIGANAFTLTLQRAQQVAVADNMVLRAGSHLWVARVS